MFSVGYPVSERVIVESDSEVVSGFMQRGSYFKTVLTGSYDHSKEAWESAIAGAAEVGAYEAIENGEPFEIYVKQVDDTPNPAEWITEIFIPVRLKPGSQGFSPPGS
jgi:effector-binding domain-containing protein